MLRWPFGKKEKGDTEKDKEDEKKYDKQIQKQLQSAENSENRTIRLLLLGPGDSGKSTIIKQMKKIHLGEESVEEDLILHKNYIGWSLVRYMKILCQATTNLDQFANEEKIPMDESNLPLRDKFLAIKDIDEKTEFPKDLVKDIVILWKDPAIQKAFELKDHYLLPDHCDYFMSRMDIIVKDGYIPNFEDFLRMRQKSSGVVVSKFVIETNAGLNYYFEFTDVGGQRSERRKWMALVKDTINCILFVLAISEYNQFCFEDNNTLRVHEAFLTFEDVVKKKFLEGKTLILFFNKYDLFVQKLSKVPIDKYFREWPEDKDATNVDDVLKFFDEKFEEIIQKNQVTLSSPHYRHVTTALDTDMMSKIFHSISNDLVKQNLKSLGVL